MVRQHQSKKSAIPAGAYAWRLNRPKPALPSSYFWTWDHSTNWILDDPGLQNSGCCNKYLKRTDTFLEDHRRLTDLASGLGIKGIVIWGFLRDAHGGVEYGKRVADYATSQGVAIMPGVGTTWYDGIYYQGTHRYCLDRFLEKYPEARMLNEDGEAFAVVLSRWNAGSLTDDLKQMADQINHGPAHSPGTEHYENIQELQRHNFWSWLHAAASGDASKNYPNWPGI